MYVMSRADPMTLRPLRRPPECTVPLPGSKSITNRALLAAALARGGSEISGLLLADDTRLMVDCLERLGVHVVLDEHRKRCRIEGCGGYFPESQAELHCGNAGTVIRLLTAACSAGMGQYTLDGDARMRQRPIGQLVNALRDLGAEIGYGGREGFCPLTVHARRLRGGRVTLDRVVSSQYVSALLMAAPLATSDVFIVVTGELPSAPYVRLTQRVMDAFGVSIIAEPNGRYIVPAPQLYHATEFAVEPDASAASYFFAAAALTGGRITVEGLGSDSAQGDVGFVRVLDRMGCRVEMAPKRTTVWGPANGRLAGIDADLGAMPDTAPTLAVLAAFAEGPTRIRNVANLRIKESDRLFALAAGLGRLGVPTQIHDDGLTIAPRQAPVAGKIATCDDHRIAMSFALAGLVIDGVTLDDPGCVAKTFPEFFDVWRQLAT